MAEVKCSIRRQRGSGVDRRPMRVGFSVRTKVEVGGGGGGGGDGGGGEA